MSQIYILKDKDNNIIAAFKTKKDLNNYIKDKEIYIFTTTNTELYDEHLSFLESEALE